MFLQKRLLSANALIQYLQCHAISTCTDLSREEGRKRLKFTNVPFIEREQKLLDPFVRCPIECVQYRMHQLRFIVRALQFQLY